MNSRNTFYCYNLDDCEDDDSCESDESNDYEYESGIEETVEVADGDGKRSIFISTSHLFKFCQFFHDISVIDPIVRKKIEQSF